MNVKNKLHLGWFTNMYTLSRLLCHCEERILRRGSLPVVQEIALSLCFTPFLAMTVKNKGV